MAVVLENRLLKKEIQMQKDQDLFIKYTLKKRSRAV